LPHLVNAEYANEPRLHSLSSEIHSLVIHTLIWLVTR